MGFFMYKMPLDNMEKNIPHVMLKLQIPRSDITLNCIACGYFFSLVILSNEFAFFFGFLIYLRNANSMDEAVIQFLGHWDY